MVNAVIGQLHRIVLWALRLTKLSSYWSPAVLPNVMNIVARDPEYSPKGNMITEEVIDWCC